MGTALEDRTDVALAVVKETDAGIIVNGARVLATLGPLSDEIIVYPARTHRLPGDAGERYAFGFALPCNTPGMKFMCRESFDLGRSHFDHPLGSRFEEMDAVVFFNNVLVPWDRVFLLGDVHLANTWAEATNRNAHTGHQVVTKNVVKCEFMLGLANLMTQTLGSTQLQQVQQMVAEIIQNLEITRALLKTAEMEAKVDRWGVMCPPYMPLLVARSMFIQMYPRMAEILHFLGSSSLMALPTEADLNGPLGEDIRQYLDTDTASAEERVRLVQAGLGHLLQFLRVAPGPVRAVLWRRPHPQRRSALRPLRQGTGYRMGAGVPGDGVMAAPDFRSKMVSTVPQWQKR